MKTKTAFLIFAILCIIIFPYHIAILFINSDSLMSIVPGWHTTIIPYQLISNLFKFLILLITTILYWKLSRRNAVLESKKFRIHFLLTIPAIFIGRFSVYEILDLSNLISDDFTNKIPVVIFINICINILFFVGQIIFWKNYYNIKRHAEYIKS